MDCEDDIIICAGALLLLEEEEAANQKRSRKRRSQWMRPLFLEGSGFYHSFRNKLAAQDPELFKSFVRMTADDFEYLLEKVSPLITKKDTVMRQAIPAGERLAITLRYLATGDSYSSLMFLFKRSKAVICQIVSDCFDALFATLKNEFLKIPNTPTEWEEIADRFWQKWNFPNCFGAIDGKHVDVQQPSKSGSAYFNYKLKNSIVLMAMVDADYNFLFIDVGAKGRESDGGVFSRCMLAKALENGSLNLPQPKPLLGRNTPVPYVMVADDAFPLKTSIMKPYNFRKQTTQERIFSYRLSRARRVVENVFGIITARFRILRKPIEMEPKKVEKAVLAICALHNFLNKRRSTYAQPGDYDQPNTDGSITGGNWHGELNDRDLLRSLHPLTNEGRGSDRAKDVREEFKNFFLNEGEIQWQYRCLYE